MKPLWNVLKIVFGGLAALILLVSVSVFIYHHYHLNKEAALLKGKGTVVNVDGKKMNVYEEGRQLVEKTSFSLQAESRLTGSV